MEDQDKALANKADKSLDMNNNNNNDHAQTEVNSSTLAVVSKKKNGGGVDDTPHRFWDSQPVPKLSEQVDKPGPLEPLKTVEEVRQAPYNLPPSYAWCAVDVSDEKQLDEVYNLLTNHYVEDADSSFRFDYSKDFLKWALQPPGYFMDWHVGVREEKTGKLYGFITGIPTHVHVRESNMLMAEINFLCVHRALRTKRLAPVLIKEVTRRVNLKNIWQAVYTAGIELPKPVTTCQYWHRNLQCKKLLDIGFTRLAPRMTLTRTIKLYKLPDENQTPGMRPMELDDVPQVAKLLNQYLKSKTKLYIEWDEKEVAHWLLPRPGVVTSYVFDSSKKKGSITAFFSYYLLPSSILRHEKHDKLNAAYSFYNVPSSEVPLKELMQEALICACNKDKLDVFNCLTLMENEQFLKDLKFGPGDGNLRYYLYNWATPELLPNENGIVLL